MMCPWMRGRNGVGLQEWSVSKLLSGSCPWPNLQLLVVWLCWDTVGIHRSPATKGHSSQDNTYLSYMLAPTKGWFLIQAPNLGCVKGYPCPESGVFRMGSWSTLVPSTAGWIPGMETGRETAAPGDRSRGQTRQYCARALKELVLTCRNHTVLCGCLAASLPLRSTRVEPLTAQSCVALPAQCRWEHGGKSGLGEAHANPHILSKLSLHDAAVLGLWLRNAQAPSLGQGSSPSTPRT